MAPDKSLAAEIEAVLRDQIVLRWMGPDSFIEGHEEAARQIAARIAALQSRAFEDGARSPSEPSPGLLMSMAMRYDHSLAMPGYRDWKTMPGLGEREPGRHARILANTMGSMRQLWEEVTGNGFYSPAREADYVASAKRCGVTFDENGRPRALAEQEKGDA